MKTRADLDKARLIVVKVGSAVLADKSSLNYDAISSLAAQITELYKSGRKIVLVSSGAVAAGKTVLRSIGKTEFANYARARHAIAAVGQSLLMEAWSRAFAPEGIITAQVLLTRDDLRSRPRFQTAASTFRDMLEWGVIPVVNENDTVSVSDLKFGDNDFLASLLVNLVEADLFINLTSAPGALDKNPDEHPDAKVMETVRDIGKLDPDVLCGAKTASGSGGMRSKLMAARRVAQLGVPTLILPGREKNIIARAFSGRENPGTWVCAEARVIPRRKFWLAYQSEPAGTLEIDEGAAKALLFEGRSLLPGGITRVTGDFPAGAPVRVSGNGQSLGVGFSAYASSDLAKIVGRKRHEVAAILGIAKYPDVIHRDNLLLDAAI